MATEFAQHEGQDDPLWKQIEAALLQQVKEGRFKSNGRLPSEFDLAAEFGVNRHTVRQAIAALVQRGLLFKRKGGGSYVVPDILDYAIGERTRFSTNVALQGREPAHTLLVVDERPVHEKAAAALKIAEGDQAVFISLIGEADDIPISVGETYLSANRFPNFGARYKETQSMTKALAHYGVVDYKRDVTRCIARMPSPADVKYLKQSDATPVLFVESVDIDLEGHPIVYHETRYAGERVQFVIRRGDL